MADNHFDQVMVWDRLGTAVRIKPYGSAAVLDPATDAPVTVTQNGQSVTTVTADANGRCSFVAQQGYVKLVDSGLVQLLVSSEAATSGASNAAAAQSAQSAAQTSADAAKTSETNAAASAASAGSAASSAASAAVAPLSAQQAQLMTVTPTIDELCIVYNTGTRNPSPIFAADFPCKIVAARAVWGGYSLAANDTNYLSLVLSKRTVADPATPLDIVAKTTQVTGGEAVTAMKSWSLNGGAWNTTNQTLAAGDVLSTRIDVVGTLSPMPGTPVLMVRYQPLR